MLTLSERMLANRGKDNPDLDFWEKPVLQNTIISNEAKVKQRNLVIAMI